MTENRINCYSQFIYPKKNFTEADFVANYYINPNKEKKDSFEYQKKEELQTNKPSFFERHKKMILTVGVLITAGIGLFVLAKKGKNAGNSASARKKNPCNVNSSFSDKLEKFKTLIETQKGLQIQIDDITQKLSKEISNDIEYARLYKLFKKTEKQLQRVEQLINDEIARIDDLQNYLKFLENENKKVVKKIAEKHKDLDFLSGKEGQI